MINDLFGSSLPHEAGRTAAKAPAPATHAPTPLPLSLGPAHDTHQTHGAMGSMGEEPAMGLDIYEDTAFLRRPSAVTAAVVEEDEPAGLAIYEDTVFLNRQGPVATVAAPSAPRPALSVLPDDDQENLPRAAAAAVVREDAHSAALQPLSASRRTALGGVEEAEPSEPLEEGEPLAHIALASIPEGAGEGDSFEVYADDVPPAGEGGAEMADDLLDEGTGGMTPAPLGLARGTPLQRALMVSPAPSSLQQEASAGEVEISVLSVFDPTVRPALVQSMEPPVGQWEGVHVSGGAECSYVMNAFTQARRTGTAALRIAGHELLLKSSLEQRVRIHIHILSPTHS